MCFWLSPLLLVLISTCYQPNEVQNFFEKTCVLKNKFNGRDSHDVITYNYASYVCKSMVDKNRIYKCISKYKFLYCKQDNHISNEVRSSDAGGTQIFASGSMDQC